MESGEKNNRFSIPRHAAPSDHSVFCNAMTHPSTHRTLADYPPREPKAKSHAGAERRPCYADTMANVLLASDIPSVRQDLRAMLEGPDLFIEEAATGPDVLRRTREGGIDLVIADLQIGTMGGMAICMELRHDESYLPGDAVSVLMLLDRRADVFLARRSGADGFLVKPLDPQRVRAAVRVVLRGEEYDDDFLRPATVRAGAER